MNIVILAAGQGKRMKSALPKVLQTLAGKPLLEHVLETAISLSKSVEPIVVIGHGGEDVVQRAADVVCECRGGDARQLRRGRSWLR